MQRIFGTGLLLMALVCGAGAQEAGLSAWSVHLQATSIGQVHGAFPALYEGPNSLPSHKERRVSLTSTVFTHWNPVRGLEVVLAPETAGGKGFGQVTGVAGFPNGEIPRVAGATPQFYIARAYLRYSWAGGVSGVAGKFAINDFFDINTYSHDPRTQFMNWSLMNNAAWDYPADTRGYTMGMVGEWQAGRWATRAGCVLEPTVANGPLLDTRVGRNRGAVMEVEPSLGARRRGAVRGLAYLNEARSGTYSEALAAGGTPDITAVRRDGARKYGFGVNAEYELARNVGSFLRYGWSDGKTESWAFTEIDRTVSGGLSLSGQMWSRARDHIGVGMAINSLSPGHRAYLAAGGLGFLLGDGALRYGPESIVEAYYALYVRAGWTVTGDYQWVADPGYNRDRGPVSVESLRLHWEH